MDALINELKEHIIEALSLDEITPEEIDAEAPLFGTGLGLDSIDALELAVMVEKFYHIRPVPSRILTRFTDHPGLYG